MGEQTLILEAHHTTHIEGTRLTLDQTKRLWKGKAVPETDPDDARKLLNYCTAFEFVSECLDSGDAPAEYRRIQNYVVNAGTGQVLYTPPTHVPPPAAP